MNERALTGRGSPLQVDASAHEYTVALIKLNIFKIRTVTFLGIHRKVVRVASVLSFVGKGE